MSESRGMSSKTITDSSAVSFCSIQSDFRFLFVVDDHGEMKQDAYTVASAAIEAHQEEKDIARAIKVRVCFHVHLFFFFLSQESFDHKYGPTWMCIVGADFNAFVTHESKAFIFFYVGKVRRERERE